MQMRVARLAYGFRFFFGLPSLLHVLSLLVVLSRGVFSSLHDTPSGNLLFHVFIDALNQPCLPSGILFIDPCIGCGRNADSHGVLRGSRRPAVVVVADDFGICRGGTFMCRRPRVPAAWARQC